MTETKAAEKADDQAQAGQGQFAIHKVYVKDASLESPNSPSIFREQWAPDVKLQMGTSNTAMGDDNFEVMVNLTVTVKSGEATAYLVEVQQAGIFQISGIPDNQMPHMLKAFCPSVLFPYAREAVSDLVTRAGFPQLLLAPVNFDAYYMQQLKDQQAAASAVDEP